MTPPSSPWSRPDKAPSASGDESGTSNPTHPSTSTSSNTGFKIPKLRSKTNKDGSKDKHDKKLDKDKDGNGKYHGLLDGLGGNVGRQRAWSLGSSSNKSSTSALGLAAPAPAQDTSQLSRKSSGKKISFSFGSSRKSPSELGDTKNPTQSTPLSQELVLAGSQHTQVTHLPPTIKPAPIDIPGSSQAIADAVLNDAHSPISPDPFAEAVQAASVAVTRMQTVNWALGEMSELAKMGGSLATGAATVVVRLSTFAEKILVGRVACLRLVQRSANVVLAVQQSIIDAHGQISPHMERNLKTLLTQLQTSERLLVKLSQRPFLKAYLHAEEASGAVQQAQTDLEDIVQIFHLQAVVESAAWQEQAKIDRKSDMAMLLDRIDTARRSDQAMFEMLMIQNEEQQEAIKTLQRTLDSLLIIQAEELRKERKRHKASRASFGTIMDSPTASLVGFGYPSNLLPLPPLTLDEDDSAWEDKDEEVRELRKKIEDKGAIRQDSPQNTVSTVNLAKPKKIRANSVDDHVDFVERALTALRRRSDESEIGIPDVNLCWTITNFEVTHSHRISEGYYSVIWKGQYQGKVVAIKELSDLVDRGLFINEAQIWTNLSHEFVLPILGASSTTAPPPWRMISPFLRNGDMLAWLASELGAKADRVKLLREVALGMEYLHSRDVFHGDLKASNVLISDNGTPQICDFGFSAIKIDISRKSKSSEDVAACTVKGGTLRWQAPELLDGHGITGATDVYAFAMTMYEVATGKAPWAFIDDWSVKTDVLHRGSRPPRPQGSTDGYWDIMRIAWSQNPKSRPTFSQLAFQLAQLQPKTPEHQASIMSTISMDSFHTATEEFGDLEIADEITTESPVGVPDEQVALSPSSYEINLPDITTNSSSSGSIHSIGNDAANNELGVTKETDRAECNYRHHLTLSSDYDDRLKIPLFFPKPVALGAVGYVRHGVFVQLFDAHTGPDAFPDGLPPLAYLDEFSQSRIKTASIGTRNVAAKGLDVIHSWTNFVRSNGEVTKQAVSRRISQPLRSGGKQAALIVENGEFQMYESFEEARLYLTENIDWIVEHLGSRHHLQRKDVIIVVGTVSSADWAFVVSDYHPKTTLTFNVHADRKHNTPWGTWTVDAHEASGAFAALKKTASSLAIKPAEEAPAQTDQLKWVCKVSKSRRDNDKTKDTVLLARLKLPTNSSSRPVLHLNREIQDEQKV